MWENVVARSRPFWEHFFPLLKDTCGDLGGLSLDSFLPAINHVQPSLIRVEADEVTYNLHIIVRFELEIALMRGDLTVVDLPEAWNEKMQELLGIRPPDYSSGVMQDVHWAAGAIGYFPTYTLGNLYAAQIYAYACDRIKDLQGLMANGDFAPLLGFLRKEIHTEGSRYLPRDLSQRVTGIGLHSDVFIDYIDRKYSELLNI
jgi:carboxypeptidase Taq